jgi:hypothetical protein
MIAETSSSELGGNKAEWITDTLSVQLPTNFPNVKAYVWFNYKKEDDWRIESSEESRKAFAAVISSSYFASNQFGGISTSPIPYLGNLSSKFASTGTFGSFTITPTKEVIPTNTPIPTPTVTISPVQIATFSSELTENRIVGESVSQEDYIKEIRDFLFLALFTILPVGILFFILKKYDLGERLVFWRKKEDFS